MSSRSLIDPDGPRDSDDVVLAGVKGVVRRFGGGGSMLAQRRLQTRWYSASASDFLSEEELVQHAERSANEQVRCA